MRRAASLILRLVCSLALILSALPIRAGVVCVSQGRIVGVCAKKTIEPAEVKALAAGRSSCCGPKCRPSMMSPARMSGSPMHCSYAYSAVRPVVLAKASPFVWADVDSPVLNTAPGLRILAMVRPASVRVYRELEQPPPRRVTWAPDRGRAPPIDRIA